MAGTAEQKAYAAGLIDGEGCISIDKRPAKSRSMVQYTPRVGVHMTDVMPLHFLASIWGGKVTKRNRTASYLSHWRDSYDWIVSAASARAFLSDISPYLHAKKEQALIALEFRAVGWGQLDDEEQQRRAVLKQRLSDMKRSGQWQPR